MPQNHSNETKVAKFPSKREFLDHVNGIDGWLDPFTAERTYDLISFQNDLGLRGPVYEIGVYRGKYFSVLLNGAAEVGDQAFGFDIYMYVKEEELASSFEDTAKRISGEVSYKFIKGNSADMSDADLTGIIGGEARFISIDGSHDHDEVYWDLTVAEKVMAPHGIIAADDFLNGTCIGTNEATNRFLINNPNVAPFAYCAGKLFICRAAWADRYKGAFEKAVIADDQSPKAAWFKENLQNNTRFNVETKFHRRQTIMLP